MNMLNARPRVLHVISPVRQGGGESLIATLLIPGDIEPLVALFYRSPAFEKTLTSRGIAWTHLTAGSLGDGKGRLGSAVRALLGLIGLVRLLRVAADFRPDVVHVHSFPGSFHIAALKTMRLITAPALLTRHSLFARHGRLTRRLFSWMLSKYEYISTVSAALRDDMLAEFPGFDVRVIHNCVADEFFAIAEAPSDTGRAVFLQLGRFTPAKNHALVLRALASLSNEERSRVAVWFAGSGETEPAIRALANKLGLGNEVVRFLGLIRHDEIPAIVAQSHFGLFPSSSEGFGIGAAECLAAGRPVLALNTPVMVEVVGAGGILVDSDRLTDGFRLLLNSGPEIRDTAKIQAERFRSTHIRAKYLAVYRDMLTAHR